mgnify:CR=1 FL=1
MHTPLTGETEKLINTDNVELAKQGQVIVNTSRGGVVDLDAIEKGLKSGRLSGAGLDVLPTEPIDYEHSLLKAFELSEQWVDGKLIITPHAAFFSPSSVKDMMRIAAENIYNFLVEPYAKAVQNDGVQRRLIFTALHETFITYLKVAFFAAIFLGCPVVLTQLWKFVAPGPVSYTHLRAHET